MLGVVAQSTNNASRICNSPSFVRPLRHMSVFTDPTNNSTFWSKHTVNFSDIAVANTDAEVELVNLPARGVINIVVAYQTTKFIGGGTSFVTVSVGRASAQTRYLGLSNIEGDPDPADVSGSATVVNYNKMVNNMENSTSVKAYFNSDANLDELTQGSVDIYLLQSVLT